MSSSPAIPETAERRQPSLWRRSLRVARRKPLGAIGAVIVALFILVAAFAPLLAPFDPNLLNASRIMVPPDAVNLMGTDEFGRDIFSRIIWGARVSVLVGFLAVSCGTTIGALIGLLSGYFGGWFDYCVQRVVDMLMAFPMLILALAMVSVLGPAIQNVIIALAVVIIPNACRVIRSSVLSLRNRPFVEASINLGFSHTRIIFGQIMPNVFATYIILATAGLGSAILSEAALSFLGLGTPPPNPSWGAMLSGRTQGYMMDAPWMAIFPGLAITLVVFGFNFLGDALRDLLDPRLRNR